MNDVETELRRYGREVLDRARPVELGEVLEGTPAPIRAAPDSSGRGRPWLLVAAAALVAVVVAGVVTLDRRPDGDDPVVPATEPDSLVDLPRPSATYPPDADTLGPDLVDTPIGTIEWTVVEGGPADVPYQIVDRPTATSVRGTAVDGSPMLSTDGGRTWEQAPGSAVATRSVGGYEWTTVDGQLARLTDDGTPVPVSIPSAVAAPGAPWEISTHVEPEFPVELNGSVYIFARTGVGLDFSQMITDPDVGRIGLLIDSAEGERTVVVAMSEDTSQTASDLELRVVEHPDSRRIDFVDRDDVTVASVDADVAGFEDFAPSDLLSGAALVQWLRFDGTNFVPVDTPLPQGGRVEVADLDGTALVLNKAGSFWSTSAPSLWRTDGLTWTALPLPGHDTSPSTSAPEGLQHGATLTATNEGAVLTTYRDDARHDLTTDGVNFSQIRLPANTSGRERLGNGWVAFGGPPAIHFSSDGAEWERVSLTSYYDVDLSSGAFGQLFLIDSTIYIVIDDNNDNLTLLIGHLNPSTIE